MSTNKKNIKFFHLKMNIFTAVKYCCILHGHVFVMKDTERLKLAEASLDAKFHIVGFDTV